MKYRKKPVEIEALQYSERNLREIVEFVGDENLELLENPECTGHIPYIRTLEGKMMVSEGDYIIKGVKGEFYPCKPDIFEQTYEKVQ